VRGVPRGVAVALFGYRPVGFGLFEATGERAVLFAFPNVFEFWFVFVAAVMHWRPGFGFTRRNTVLVLGVLLGLKELQEYALHVGRRFDGFNSIDGVEAVFDWVTGPFRQAAPPHRSTLIRPRQVRRR
jgi:hypothetical protein